MRRIRFFWRAIRPGVPWLAALALVLASLVLWVAGLDTDAGFFLIVLAAATSLLQLFRQFADSDDQRSRNDAQQAQLEEQARDLKRLADIAERTQEAQQQHQPAPVLNVIDRRTNETGDHLSLVRPPIPVVDRDDIVRKRMAQLREGLSPSSDAPGEYANDLMASIARLSLMDDDAYRKDLDRYETDLAAWVDEVAAALARQYEVVHLPLEVHNAGGAPLQKAEVVLTFPIGISGAEAPSVPDGPPAPPKRRNRLDALSTYLPDVSSSFPDFTSTVGMRQIEGPFISDDGSQAVWELAELLHQRKIEISGDDALWVEAEDGEYELGWEIHSTNLLSPVPGTIRVNIATLATEPMRFAELEPLVAAFWGDE